MDAGEYFDDLAPFYDAKYEDQGDVEFYVDLATEADGPVLEVGCGTGRIYLEMLRAGVDADGIDVSAGMLAELREKAAAEGLEPSVRRADVTAFAPDREYALAIVPFRTFLHLLSVDDQLAALERLHGALAPGGRLALNAFVPSHAVISEEYGEWREREIEVDGESYALRTHTALIDEVDRIARIRTAVVDGGETIRKVETEIALLSPREFDLLFRLSPFESWTVYGGFEYEPLESADQEQVWIARR